MRETVCLQSSTIGEASFKESFERGDSYLQATVQQVVPLPSGRDGQFRLILKDDQNRVVGETQRFLSKSPEVRDFRSWQLTDPHTKEGVGTVNFGVGRVSARRPDEPARLARRAAEKSPEEEKKRVTGECVVDVSIVNQRGD